MTAQRMWLGGVCLGAMLAAQLMGADDFAGGPNHDMGDSVTGAFEGWYRNTDGTLSFLLGYYNRNQKQELDIPVGPNNKIEPGGPDQGQPTHFLPRRGWGVFTVNVPKDFPADRKLTWTLTANGKTTVIPFSLNELWEIRPFSEDTMNDTPPAVRFTEDGKTAQGPVAHPVIGTATVKVGEPLTLNVWADDDAATVKGGGPASIPKTPPIVVSWSKFRGPGEVTFANAKPEVVKMPTAREGFKVSGKATTTATFSAPGEYLLLLVGNDWSGEGGRGFLCCWTDAQMKVTVTGTK